MSYPGPRASGRGGGGGAYEGYAIGALALLALALVGGAWGAAELAAATSGAPKPPGDPFKLLGDLAGRGRFAWAPADSYWAAGLGGASLLFW